MAELIRKSATMSVVLAVGVLLSSGPVWSADPPTAKAPAPLPAGATATPSPASVTDFSKPQFDTRMTLYDVGGQLDKSAGTVVAEVDGRAITLGDVGEEIRSLPPSLNGVAFEALYPAILERLVRQQALVIRAQSLALDEDPTIRRRLKAAVDKTLENAALLHDTEAMITEKMVLDRYNRDIAGKPGPEEVRARIIVTPTETEARATIAELLAGADFATLARARSKDSTARVGGDLGYVRWNMLSPDISSVLFTLNAGQVGPNPIQGPLGWFILKSEERRLSRTPTLSESRETLRQALAREGVAEVTKQALASVFVRTYSITGKEADEGSLRPNEEKTGDKAK